MSFKEFLLKSKNSIGLAVRLIVSAALIAVIIWKFRDLQNIDVRQLIGGISSIWIFIATIFGIYFVKGVTLVVPASLVYIAVGMAINPFIAILINTAGILIEISVTYLMGLILGGPYVLKKIKKTKYGEKITSIYDKYQGRGIFLIRFLWMPIDICSLFFGSMRSRFPGYILMSMLGILPRVIIFTILGDKVYDLIPMKYIIPAAAILIVVLLLVWIIKYMLRTAKEEKEFGKPVYVPINAQSRNVILDTDMGPDCDDAGALAILLEYAKSYNINILGICNCTSNPYANGAIRAICKYYGFNNPNIGQYSGSNILPDGLKYNKTLTEKYCKDDINAISAKPAAQFYRDILSKVKDNSVTVISIGTFSSIAEFLNEDASLFNKKVHSMVSMAGIYPAGKEFNITSDPLAAKIFFEKYKKTLVLSDFNIGINMKTGFDKEINMSPVFDAYYYYKDCQIPCENNSFDLTAVQYAFEGNGNFYNLSKPMKVSIGLNGEMTVTPDKYSNIHFMIKKESDEQISDYLNIILRNRQEPVCE